MSWLRSSLIDNAIKKLLLERSGGLCECRLPEHNHAGGRCGETLHLRHHYYRLPDHHGKRAPDIWLICPTCYRAMRANHMTKQ